MEALVSVLYSVASIWGDFWRHWTELQLSVAAVCINGPQSEHCEGAVGGSSEADAHFLCALFAVDGPSMADAR